MMVNLIVLCIAFGLILGAIVICFLDVKLRIQRKRRDLIYCLRQHPRVILNDLREFISLDARRHWVELYRSKNGVTISTVDDASLLLLRGQDPRFKSFEGEAREKLSDIPWWPLWLSSEERAVVSFVKRYDYKLGASRITVNGLSISHDLISFDTKNWHALGVTKYCSRKSSNQTK